MVRWTFVAVLFLTCLTPASASLSHRPQPSIRRDLPGLALTPIRPAPANREYRLTEKTEVLLNGQPCRYEDVPDGATIILLETVSNEDREIVRLHFETSPNAGDTAFSQKRPKNASTRHR